MDFRSLVLEGLFQEQAGELKVLTQGTEEHLLGQELQPFLGRRVMLVLHYAPVEVDPARWGMGCCHWEKTGHCPVGHQDTPNKMLVFKGSGILTGDPWAIDGQCLPLASLPGHDARLVVASDFQPQKIAQGDIGSLMEQMTAMQQFLATLTDKTRGKR